MIEWPVLLSDEDKVGLAAFVRENFLFEQHSESKEEHSVLFDSAVAAV